MAATATANSATSHARPFLTAEWRYVAMLNFEIEPALVQPFVPRGTRLDFFQGKTFVSLVGFLFRDTRVLGLPIPYHRNFEELNLRCYVVREEANEVRRGVVFLKELVPRWAVTKIARWAYNENYETVPMRHTIAGVSLDQVTTHNCAPQAAVQYQWKKAGAWHELNLHVRGTATPLQPASHVEFIAEHYWGYCRQRDGGTIEYRVEHPPWNVWTDCDATLRCDTRLFYPPPFVEVLSRPPSSAFLLDGSAVTVYRPRRIEQAAVV